MKKCTMALLLGILLCGTVPIRCMASYITLKINPASIYQKGRIGVKVDVTNKGDESAMSVLVEATLGNSSSRSEIKEALEINETFRTVLDLGQAPYPPGIYTIIIKTHYTDVNGHPFTALRAIPLVLSEPDPLEELITAKISSVKIEKTGEVVLLVRRSSLETDIPIDAKVTLVLPEELQCLTSVMDVSISPGKDKTIHFKINNLSALPGSTYSVFAVIDYLHGGQHRSLAALGSIKIKPYGNVLFFNRIIWLVLIIFLLAVFAVLQFIRSPSSQSVIGNRQSAIGNVFPYLVLAILLAFTLYHIPPSYLVSNTLTAGGDTPAHSYLASHLKEQLFGHGRIVSWAKGWWCGFPMFQFYFCLPYLFISLLSFIIPFNVAFKLVSVLGIFALPAIAYLSARITRLSRPIPTLIAIAMIPLLFDNSHTMWGVNIYSTFAGMISNSISFPIMLLFIASAYRDSDDGQFRLTTVFLLMALIASHFFTFIIAGMGIAVLPLLRPKAGARQALLVMIKECGLAILLMAWWLIPLVAKRQYAVDFGVNWDIKIRETLPLFVVWLIPFMIIAITLGVIQRIKFVLVICWMLMVSIFLFYFGNKLSPVFVNVRLWPFIIYTLLTLASIGIGMLISTLRVNKLATAAILIAALTFGIGAPNTVRDWTKWNYEGLEKKVRWPVFKKLVLPLRGTPGRLANDLHDDNNSLGSTRIFECVPHLIGKSILEGGVVNSGLGSMFSYYIQGETSKNCAGFPTIVTPTSFNFTNATKHLELFNVKHFIARWSKTKEALERSKEWRLISKSQAWELYELLTHDGSYVFIPQNYPIAVKTDNWKKAGLEWIYTIQAIDQPFVLLRHGEYPDKRFETTLTEKEFIDYLSEIKNQKSKIKNQKSKITRESVTDNRIRFRTKAIGLPHIIKCSYYPNWKVRGAKKVYMVTPCFMLVYPDQEEVELYYGYTLSDNIGRGLTLLGIAVLGIGAWTTDRAKGKYVD